eukprot:5536811-Pyramimonas_sp.AAC.1
MISTPGCSEEGDIVSTVGFSDGRGYRFYLSPSTFTPQTPQDVTFPTKGTLEIECDGRGRDHLHGWFLGMGWLASPRLDSRSDGEALMRRRRDEAR